MTPTPSSGQQSTKQQLGVLRMIRAGRREMAATKRVEEDEEAKKEKRMEFGGRRCLYDAVS
jgi:hypothetical protein